MFHWICPECGREISPTVRECPACDPKAIAVEPAPPAVVESARDAASSPSPVGIPPAVSALVLEASAAPELAPPPLPEPAPAEPVPVAATAGIPADPTSLRELALALGIIDAESQLTVAVAAPVDAVAEPVAAPSSPMEPELPPVAALGLSLSTPVLEIGAPQVPVALLAPPEAAPATEPPPPPAQSTTPELSAPGPLLAMAPLKSYSPMTSRRMQPVPPETRILMPDSGPRITLPGPTLPPELLSLKDAGVVTVFGDPSSRRTRGVPGWLVSMFVTVTLLVTGVTVLFYLLPHSTADAKPAPPSAQPAAAPASTHPLANYVEVTGFRIAVDLNKKSEIHYIVVNHSAADLPDLNVFVTLRSADAQPGQPPISRFSFKAPNLGPFESKEMTSSLERLSRLAALPEWQDLRAEVQIAR
jgi:hypothetical protein